MNALSDAIAASCPPERELNFEWPGTMIFNGGRIGGGRLGWPEACRENEMPDWLVFSAMITAAWIGLGDPGTRPAATALEEEGFEADGPAVVESFARYLMLGIDTLSEQGFDPIAERYLARLAIRKAGERRGIAGNGDLLIHRPAGVERFRTSRGRFGSRLGSIRQPACRRFDMVLKLPRTIRLDPSDTLVFKEAAEPGEWAVTGSFLFWDMDVAALTGKARAAFRAGFISVRSFGFSTLVVVTEARPDERDDAVETLAQQLLARVGAPSLDAARAAAQEEVAFAASLCQHEVNTILAMHRTIEGGEIKEQFRALACARSRGGAAPTACMPMPAPSSSWKATTSQASGSISSA